MANVHQAFEHDFFAGLVFPKGKPSSAVAPESLNGTLKIKSMESIA